MTLSEQQLWVSCFQAALTGTATATLSINADVLAGRAACIADAALEQYKKRMTSDPAPRDNQRPAGTAGQGV